MSSAGTSPASVVPEPEPVDGTEGAGAGVGADGAGAEGGADPTYQSEKSSLHMLCEPYLSRDHGHDGHDLCACVKSDVRSRGHGGILRPSTGSRVLASLRRNQLQTCKSLEEQ
jgi:hypothetical protein